MIKEIIGKVTVLKASPNCYLTDKEGNIRASELWLAKDDKAENYVEVVIEDEKPVEDEVSV